MVRVEVGSVHGRFQPFHNGHLDYVLQAFGRAEFVFVGLTQIVQPEAEQGSPRNRPSSNPLTFFERRALVQAALVESGIRSARFAIIPFPIETPEVLHQFFPTSYTCFTTIMDDWNREKIGVLRKCGYDVVVLDSSYGDGARVTTGTEIRQLIRSGEPRWKGFVPPAVANAISADLLSAFVQPRV